MNSGTVVLFAIIFMVMALAVAWWVTIKPAGQRFKATVTQVYGLIPDSWRKPLGIGIGTVLVIWLGAIVIPGTIGGWLGNKPWLAPLIAVAIAVSTIAAAPGILKKILWGFTLLGLVLAFPWEASKNEAEQSAAREGLINSDDLARREANEKIIRRQQALEAAKIKKIEAKALRGEDLKDEEIALLTKATPASVAKPATAVAGGATPQVQAVGTGKRYPDCDLRTTKDTLDYERKLNTNEFCTVTIPIDHDYSLYVNGGCVFNIPSVGGGVPICAPGFKPEVETKGMTEVQKAENGVTRFVVLGGLNQGVIIRAMFAPQPHIVKNM